MATAKSKASTKKVATEVMAEVAKGLMAEIESNEATKEDKRFRKTNTSGGILQAKMTLQMRENAPNPLVCTCGEDIRWIPRGVEVTVPWYVVQLFKDNIERRYKKAKDPDTGKNIVTGYDAPSEAISYTPIDPAPGVTL
jgi:hypothetical protein